MEAKDAYICYNRADAAWVEKLAEQIESESIDGTDSGRRLSAFFDSWDIDAGQSLIDQMNAGMDSARHVIPVLSPEFFAADWPRFEWKHLVAEDPNNIRGKLIPVLLRDLSLDGATRINYPAPFRDLKHLDFRKAADFRRSFTELVRRVRNLPPERGQRLAPMTNLAPTLPVANSVEASWQPDLVNDLLLSNLLPVLKLPNQIASATTEARSKKEVWEKAAGAPPFILKEGRLFTFARLSDEDCPLRAAINPATIRSESRHDWFIHQDRFRWLIEMLNTSLTSHLRSVWIRQDGKGRFFFLPGEGETDRVCSVPGGRARVVTAKKSNPQTGSSFWVHLTARMRFQRIGERLFLSVEPAFLFTTDGMSSVAGKSAGKLSLLWGGRQQNVDILRNLLFWSGVLARGKDQIQITTGGDPLLLGRVPGSARLSVGIAGDEVRVGSLLAQADSDLDQAAADLDLAEDDDDESEEGTE
ncbi:MAG: hypothetical protein QOD99_2555 [Chthoniobacter sp.]|jgi:hypothetical protein|nr:hypothetical protein [Chthoniobacter sp.]